MVKKICQITLFWVILTVAFAKTNNLRPYRLINADSLIVEKKNNFYHTNLIGNVHFFYGSTEFFCDLATVNEETKITTMNGNVKVYEDTLSLFAQNSEYHRNEEKIYLNRDVKAVQLLPDSTENIFWAQHITYIRNDSILIAQDDVKAISQKESLAAESGFLKYDLIKHYGYLLKKPFVSKTDNGKIFNISAQKIEYFDDYKKIVASFGVKATFEDYNIHANYLIYFSNEEKVAVIGNPKFESEQATAFANQFVFYLKKNKLKQAILMDSCKVYYKIYEEDSTKINYVFADKINLDFNQGVLHNMTAKGSVKTYYKQEKSLKKDFAENWVTGDSLYFVMKDNKIQSIFMKKAKNGKYFFEK